MLTWAIIWKYRYTILTGFLVLVIIVGALMVYRCSKPQPHINEQELGQAANAIRTHNNGELANILANSDARVTQAETNNNQAAANTRDAAKKDYSNMNTDDLAAEIERRAKNP